MTATLYLCRISTYVKTIILLVKTLNDKANIIPGRNDPCTCGSGKKYKKCCLNRPPKYQGFFILRWIASIYTFFLTLLQGFERSCAQDHTPESARFIMFGMYPVGFFAGILTLLVVILIPFGLLYIISIIISILGPSV